jgi:hypothetical protein
MTSPGRRLRESTPSPTWSLTAEKADRTPVHAFSPTGRAGPSRSFDTQMTDAGAANCRDRYLIRDMRAIPRANTPAWPWRCEKGVMRR